VLLGTRGALRARHRPAAPSHQHRPSHHRVAPTAPATPAARALGVPAAAAAAPLAPANEARVASAGMMVKHPTTLKTRSFLCQGDAPRVQLSLLAVNVSGGAVSVRRRMNGPSAVHPDGTLSKVVMLREVRWARRLGPSAVRVGALHPGHAAAMQLARPHVFLPFAESPGHPPSCSLV
jgi:hypothetical protein